MGNEYSGYVLESEGITFSGSEKQLLTENIKRILSTRKGERLNNPSFGSNLKSFLFAPQVSLDNVLEEIKYSIESNEPRVKVKSCTLSATQDGEVTVNLGLLIIKENSATNENIEVKI